MKIAVVGPGGVGGYFGGRLAEAGVWVGFLARGAHLEALREGGLRVESVEGDFQVRPVAAASTAEELGHVDFVLLAVKAWQVPEAARQLGPLLGPETTILPLQNGVEAADQVGKVVGAERVLGGLCRIASYLLGAGHIRHVGIAPRIVFGERDRSDSPRTRELLQLFQQAKGLTAERSDDIEAALWEKFLFIAPLSAVGAATRMPVGIVRALPETRELLAAAMREVAALAQARGVRLAGDAVERTLAYVDSLPAETQTSLQRDFVEGRASELQDQAGAVVRLAGQAGVPVPVTASLFAALLPAELQARGLAPAEAGALRTPRGRRRSRS